MEQYLNIEILSIWFLFVNPHCRSHFSQSLPIYQDLDSLKNRVRPCLEKVCSERQTISMQPDSIELALNLRQVNDFLYS